MQAKRVSIYLLGNSKETTYLHLNTDNKPYVNSLRLLYTNNNKIIYLVIECMSLAIALDGSCKVASVFVQAL